MKPWYKSTKLWTAFGTIVTVALANLGLDGNAAAVVSGAIVTIGVTLIAGKTSQNNTAANAKSEADLWGDSDRDTDIAKLQSALADLEKAMEGKK